MEVKVLSSGSQDGNCTWLKGHANNILLDVGITFKKLQQRLDFTFIDFAFITHEHKDHANLPAIKRLLERGTKVVMSKGTQKALNLYGHNLIPVDTSTAGELQVFSTLHDAAEPVAFCLEVEGEKVYYITDTGRINFPITDATILIVEANHSKKLLAESCVDDWRKLRVGLAHLSIERLMETLKNTDLSKCKEIHLIHISNSNGDRTAFKEMLKPITGNVPVYAH